MIHRKKRIEFALVYARRFVASGVSMSEVRAGALRREAGS